MSRPPNFDRVARLYRFAEYLSLGPLLQRTRTHFLPQLTHVRHALVLGDGDGRFLARLLQQNRGLQAVAVDTSARMLKLLAERCHVALDTNNSRLRTLQASALSVRPAKDTDLIVTHFFLDCLTQVEVDTLTLRLAASLRPGALWVVSDFGIPDGPVRAFARLYVRGLYLAFRVLTGLRVTHLPNPAAALTAAGFACVAHHRKLAGILYTEVWQLQSTQQRIQLKMSTSTDTTERQQPDAQPDPLPDPEPAVPSLAQPDPAVFHHDIQTPEPNDTP